MRGEPRFNPVDFSEIVFILPVLHVALQFITWRHLFDILLLAVRLIKRRCLNITILCLHINNFDGFATDEVLFGVLVDIQLHLISLGFDVVWSLLAHSCGGTWSFVIGFLDHDFVADVAIQFIDTQLHPPLNILLLLLNLPLLHPLVLLGRLLRILGPQLLDLVQGFLSSVAHNR